MADENRLYQLKTQQIFLNFVSLVPTSLDSYNESISSNSLKSESQYGTPRSYLDDGKTNNLTVIKKDKKLLVYRNSSISSPASSVANSQQSSDLSFSKSHEVSFDIGGCPKEEKSVSESPSIEEIKSAHAYIDISDQECDEDSELRKEIITLKSQVKDELRRSPGTQSEVMFDYVDGSEEGMEEVAIQAGIKLRAVADKFNEQHCQEIKTLVDQLIEILTNNPSNFQSTFVSRIGSLVNFVGTGINAVALIFSVAQCIVTACSGSLRSVMAASIDAVRRYEGEYMKKEGWKIMNELDVEFVGSSVDSFHVSH